MWSKLPRRPTKDLAPRPAGGPGQRSHPGYKSRTRRFIPVEAGPRHKWVPSICSPGHGAALLQLGALQDGARFMAGFFLRATVSEGSPFLCLPASVQVPPSSPNRLTAELPGAAGRGLARVPRHLSPAGTGRPGRSSLGRSVRRHFSRGSS